MAATDQILCRGITCDCEIGFHDAEQGRLQKLVIDFAVDVVPLLPFERDKPAAVRLDYSVAVSAITALVEGKKHLLIETVAEEIADYLLGYRDVLAVSVTVTKFPEDLANVASVACVCRRTGKK
jgi:dihydroneopterin aldolase